MQKLITGTTICICIFCFLSTGWAWWSGYVVLDSTGEIVEGAEVHAYSDQGCSDTVYTNADGRWVLNHKSGMEEDQEYGYIYAEKTIDDKVYGNYVSDGVYYHLPHVQKDTIRLVYPARLYPLY